MSFTKYAMLSAAAVFLTGPVWADSPPPVPRAMLKWYGHRMYEDFSARSQVSPDGKWVLRTSLEGRQTLLSLPEGIGDERKLKGNIADFERAAWCAGELIRLGSGSKGRRWYASAGAATVELTVPPDATPVCSPDGRGLAYFTSGSLFLGSRASQSEIALGGLVTSATFAPDGGKIYALVRRDDGTSTLFGVAMGSHKIETLARDLDAWPFPGPELTVTGDGAAIILPLATSKRPVDAERQVPVSSHRWLKLYRFDLRSRQLTMLHSAERSDQVDPMVVGRSLYWISSRTEKRVMAMSVTGGPMHVVAAGREQSLPSWSRDGRRIAYVTGDYRLADWALSQDLETVAVDTEARITGAAKSLVVGNHEDWPVDWSPDGRWIAWHSHRAPRARAYYDAPGTTDDILIRRADDLQAPEIRATRGLWEAGFVYWSPDGTELLYTTLDRNDPASPYRVRTTRFDAAKGAIGDERPFPMPAQVRNPGIAIWSPSGEEIAVEDMVSATQRTLWIVSRDGRTATRVIDYPSETHGGLDWTPDGKRLIYAGLEGSRMQIFSIPRSGGTPRRLSDGKGNYLTPRISPDGRWIACSQIETVETLQKMAIP